MDSRHHRILISALEQAADALVLIDASNRIQFCNAAAERLWGCDGGALRGRQVAFLDSPGTGPILGGSSGASREIRIERPDGQEIYGSVSLFGVDVDGAPHYAGFVRDVTEDVGRREELRLLSLAVNETDRAMLVLDRDRRVIYVNRAFTKLFGYSLADVHGMLPTDLLAGEGTDADALARIRRKSWEAQGFTDDILAYDRQGNAIWVSAAVNPILDAEGTVANVVIVLTDITVLKRIHAMQDDVLEALASGASLSEVTDFMCRRAERIAPDVVASILLVDAERKVRPLAGPSLPAVYCQAIDGAPIGEVAASCGTAAWRGESVYVTDIDTDPLWADYKHLALPHGLRACWSSPIKLRDGRVAGTFAFYYREPRGPTPFHEQIVKACLHLSKLAIEREETRRQIAQLSSFDPLTGLPNRARLLDEVETLIRSSRGESPKIAFFMLDIDRFKDVNSGLGHAMGDKVLIEAAYRLERAVAGLSGIVSRTAGDSFAIVLPDCDVGRASAKADQLLRAVAQPIEVPGYALSLSASIGISIYGDNGTELAALINHAEMAMFQAKAAGRGTYRFFSAEMNQLAEGRLVLGTALRNALASNLLRLHYQPQIVLDSQALYGVEALARWHDPVHGPISPGRFIALAEEIGLIETIGHWSLREACRQMAAWRSGGIPIPTISVNLSPLHFADCRLPNFIADLLGEFDLPAQCLTIEITESVMMGAGAETLKTLAALHELGTGLSMDDFGTGFSSLSSLTQMPISELKLDQSFMRNFETDPSAQTVTTAVVRIGQSLGMTVVAEGVETGDQARLLGLLDCTVAQGYHFAKPMAPGDLEQWLTAYTGGLGTNDPLKRESWFSAA